MTVRGKYSAVFFSFIVTSLSGSPPRSGTVACQASAFLVESAIWGEYLFTIAVAVVSYCILLHPLSSFTLALEKYWFLVDIGVCISALGVAGLHAGLYPAVYVGGFCWNVSNQAIIIPLRLRNLPYTSILRDHNVMYSTSSLIVYLGSLCFSLSSSCTGEYTRIFSARDFRSRVLNTHSAQPSEVVLRGSIMTSIAPPGEITAHLQCYRDHRRI